MVKKKLIEFIESKPEWLNSRLMLLISTVLIFTMALTWGEPVPQAAAMNFKRTGVMHTPLQNTTSDDQLLVSQQPLDLPTSWMQTNGILLGCVVLVLIIIGVSIHALRQDLDEIPFNQVYSQEELKIPRETH
jgi:glucose uptake protein GlcU